MHLENSYLKYGFFLCVLCAFSAPSAVKFAAFVLYPNNNSKSDFPAAIRAFLSPLITPSNTNKKTCLKLKRNILYLQSLKIK